MLKSDRWIRKNAQEHDMINPFSEKQVREGVIVEMQLLEVVERGLEPARDEVAAPGWEVPDEQVERRGVVEIVRRGARRHRELVQVGEQRRVGIVDPGHRRRPIR